MFSSIKWKFIVVYFLLVFIAMVIVGIFIIGKLETQQIAYITTTMEQHIETIVGGSSYLAEDEWDKVSEEIQATLNDWRLGGNDVLYVIYNNQVPTIVASTSQEYERVLGQNALSHKLMDPTLILKAYEGEKAPLTIEDNNEDVKMRHLAYPVYTGVGKVKGVIYMVSSLEHVYKTVDEAKVILTNATMIALLITIILGYLIASSITEPIRDVTRKAEEMALGDFDQFVDVKSDDEIGQLANMFNYLTLELRDTIQEMDLERSKLDTIFSYMTEGVVAIDLKGDIIHANPIAIELLELREDNIFSLENLNLNRINYDKEDSLEGDETLELNSHVYKVKYAPFKNEKNRIGGLILVFQDITKEHKLDSMRKEFVANVSHELKTPITTIKSYTETLMDNDLEKSTEKGFLEVIDNECDRMARLVRDLLQLSNLDYKKVDWKRENVSLENLLKDILKKLEFAFREKEQEIIFQLEDNLPDVLIDKDGMEQVILNIVSNAIKYTDRKGTIEIKLASNDGSILILVKDNGIGIPEEDQDRIFERFYRVEKGRSRESGGTGLGLAIAREIIEAHRGQVFIESSYGEGTSVKISIPLEKSVIQT